MNLTALLLSLGSGLAWAAVDATRKRFGDGGCHPAAVVLLMTVAMTVGFGAYVGATGSFNAPSAYAVPLVVVVVANVAANLLFVRSFVGT